MSENKPVAYKSVVKYANEIEMIDKVLSFYSVANFEEKDRLKNYEKNILIYYVRKGITEESLEDVCVDRNIKKNYLHKVNKDLRDKGYLVMSETNYRKFHLNKDLQDIRTAFIENKASIYLITLGQKR
jgi:hypothetical protein